MRISGLSWFILRRACEKGLFEIFRLKRPTLKWLNSDKELYESETQKKANIQASSTVKKIDSDKDIKSIMPDNSGMTEKRLSGNKFETDDHSSDKTNEKINAKIDHKPTPRVVKFTPLRIRPEKIEQKISPFTEQTLTDVCKENKKSKKHKREKVRCSYF